MPAPYSITDNEDSFLDATDLVFIDAISTGYSRPAPGENARAISRTERGRKLFCMNFIYQYITRKFALGFAAEIFNRRKLWNHSFSCNFLGTLQRRNEIYLNGIVLVSAVMNFDSLNFGPGNDLTAVFLFLPTYATTAWYHHLLSADMQKLGVEQIAQRARRICGDGEYASGADAGRFNLPAAERIRRLWRISRASPDFPTKYIEETNLRINDTRWFKELLREKRRTVGRLDSRFEGMDADAAGERSSYDPSEASYEGAYAAAFQDYARRELKFETEGYYAVSGNVHPWDENADIATRLLPKLVRAAMTQQTYLKVLVVCGYYDVATVFHGVEHTVDHMGLGTKRFARTLVLRITNPGHMVYIDERKHAKLHRTSYNFINWKLYAK